MSVLDIKAILTLDASQYEQGLRDAGNAVQSGLGTVAKVGAAAVAAATAAVAGFAASSVKTGATFDKSMSQVAATMGLSMEQMANEVGTVDLAWGTFSGNLREYAQEMGRNTAFSATEAADALNYMALAGYDTQTSMQMLPNVLNLAAAGSMDLARASDMVTDTQTAFGISLERTSQMVDEMAKAASTGNTSVEQLGDAFLTIGGLAQELNGGMVTLADGTQLPVDGLQELEIALTAMANAGIKGSEAGTHMRNMLLKLSSPTDAGTKQLEALGVAVFDTEGQMRSLSDIFGDLNGSLENLTQEQKIQAIADLFNTRDLASAEAILNAVGQDWDEIGASILDAEGAAQKMANTQLDNLAGDITLFKSALEGAQIAISDELTPSLREFVQFGTDGLSKITEAFKNGGISGAIDAFGEILADGIVKVTDAIPKFITAGGQLLAAIGKGLIDNSHIIFNAILQVAGLALNYMLTAFERLASAIAEFDWASAATQAAELLVDTFAGEGMTRFVTAAIEIITGLATGLVEALPILLPAIVQIIFAIAEALITNIPTILTAAGQIISGLASGLLSGISAVLDSIGQILRRMLEAIYNSMPEWLQNGINVVVNIASGIINAIGRIISAIAEVIRSIADPLINAARTALSWGANIIIQLASAIMGKLGDVISAVASVVFEIATGIGQAVSDALTWGAEIVENIASAISAGVGNVATAIGEVVNTITTKIKGVVDSALQWGRDLMTNFISGISEKIKALFDKIASIGQGIKDRIGFSEPRLGPLSNFHTYAPDMIDLFVKGLQDNEHKIQEQLSKSFNMPEISAATVSMDTEQSGEHGHEAQDQFSTMADAFVNALERVGLKVEMDRREFGRVVRRAIA